jgi:hypothetical protein
MPKWSSSDINETAFNVVFRIDFRAFGQQQLGKVFLSVRDSKYVDCIFYHCPLPFVFKSFSIHAE